jgi:hypothetical protein
VDCEAPIAVDYGWRANCCHGTKKWEFGINRGRGPGFVPYRLDCRQSCFPGLGWTGVCVVCLFGKFIFYTSGLSSVICWCCNAFRGLAREEGGNSETIDKRSRHNRDISFGARRFEGRK